MRKPSIGSLDHPAGKVLTIDVPRMLKTRMLIQSNSGGGKSWAIRRLLEQTARHVQQIVLDTEDEFFTLREKFDYVICAPQGADAIVTPATAALLARRLRETRVSAIIGLYELKMSERRRFVRLFLEELVEAPKKLWHPAIVVVDEAHLYCPEKDKAESMSAVIDLATRGRKRGLCAVLATQRISKLHKDTAAELLNKLIGRTGLDVDVKRAADELGMTYKQATPILRNLEPGEFYAFGPAFSKEIVGITVGPVKTTHPEIGDKQISAPPPPSSKIKSMLAKLSDLPKEAEQEARTVNDLKRENITLRRELTQAKKAIPAPVTPKIIEVPILSNAIVKDATKAADAITKAADKLLDHQTQMYTALATAIGKMTNAAETIRSAVHAANKVPSNQPAIKPARTDLVEHPVTTRTTQADGNTSTELGKCERAILAVLAQHEECDRNKLTLLAGYRFSGGFKNSLAKLRGAGYLEGGNTGIMHITTSGLSALGTYDPLPRGQALRDYWLSKFGVCERAILNSLFNHPTGLDKDNILELTGYRFSGGFKNSLSKLRTAGVLIGKNTEIMCISKELLL